MTHERRGVTVASHCAGSTAIDGATTWYRLLNLNIDRIVTIQHILPRSATLGLMLFHEIWIPTLKKQR